MPRTTSGDGRERLRRMSVAFLTELMNPPELESKEAVEQHAVTIDGLADDLLEADAEGAVLFLGELAARTLEALCEKTGTDPLVTLQGLALQAPPVRSRPRAGGP
jgi:hypothetical protein